METHRLGQPSPSIDPFLSITGLRRVLNKMCSALLLGTGVLFFFALYKAAPARGMIPDKRQVVVVGLEGLSLHEAQPQPQRSGKEPENNSQPQRMELEEGASLRRRWRKALGSTGWKGEWEVEGREACREFTQRERGVETPCHKAGEKMSGTGQASLP